MPGNDYADKLATDYRDRIGKTWTNSLWNVDTTRRILRGIHSELDASAGTGPSRSLDARPFRFVRVPTQLGPAPSGPLPSERSCPDEILLYRARLGHFPAAGGVRHNADDPCPLCDEHGTLGRRGKTMLHLVRCAARVTSPPLIIDTDKFWLEPTRALPQLHALLELVRETPQGRRITAAYCPSSTTGTQAAL